MFLLPYELDDTAAGGGPGSADLDLFCGNLVLVRARRADRLNRLRSSTPLIVHHATGGRHADRTSHECPAEQLALDLEVNLPGPRLVEAVPPATKADDMAHASPTIGRPVAQLGDFLAQVLDFHEAFDLPREPLPSAYVTDVVARLRVRLLREEVEEFAAATERRNLVGIADALADIVYVAYGSAVTYGINLDAVLSEVHRANMSKLDEQGRPVLREDGKVLKSARYCPPDVPTVLERQLQLFDPEELGTSSSSVAG
jgi:predicted HAD superfamily Cof-like phosphohydrolase